MVVTSAASSWRLLGTRNRVAQAAVVASVMACCSDPQPVAPDSGPPGDAGDVREERDIRSSDAPGDTTVPTRHGFRRIRLSSEFYCEGATYGDFDCDGDTDVATGPHWYEGPSFTVEHEIYPPQAYDPKGYSDCFFLFSRDFDGDGSIDILRVGFPGQDASWFENPAPGGGHWLRHQVVNVVDTESPDFTDITGDGSPELVFATEGRLGWAGPDSTDAARPWTFHPMTPPLGFHAFTHGLGVGDVDSDGRRDVLEAGSWWKQPPSLAGDPPWPRHPATFGSGGAQMAAVDIDGDGDADVIAEPRGPRLRPRLVRTVAHRIRRARYRPSRPRYRRSRDP